jgi:hypothetical protein
MLNPVGPMNTPAMISPMILGILNFFSKTGASKIINRIIENSRIGSLIGSLTTPR